VRDLLVHGDVVVTCGEDTRLVLWGDPDRLEAALAAAAEATGAGRSERSLFAPATRHAPY
jgi:hypothetical protein